MATRISHGTVERRSTPALSAVLAPPLFCTALPFTTAVFPVNPDQRNVALAYIAQLEKAHVFSAPVVTRVEQFKGFYPAENYHQNYLALHPYDPYILINDRPKINELKRMFPDRYREDPVLLKTAA